MSEYLFNLARGWFHDHGYWTVFIALMLENTGLPVPGETILLFASFLAFSERDLQLPYIIVVGTGAATASGLAGYAIGRHGGRTLLARYQRIFHVPQSTIERGERWFARSGSMTIFFARFVFFMRALASPLAGVLNMPWQRFAIFNFLGAVIWVTIVSLVGYFFGRHWETLLKLFKQVNIGVVIAVAALVVFFWWRRRQRSGFTT